MSDDEHKCLACPVEVRGLYAAAHNALGAYQRGDLGDRVGRKMAELADALARIAPHVEQHFAETGVVEDAARAIAKNMNRKHQH